MSPDQDSAPYLPFDGGRFRLMMGLMPLPPGDWIEIDRHFAAALVAKRALLETRHGEVFAALAVAEAPAAEALALLAEYLPRHHAATFRRDGDRLRNLATAESWDLAQPRLHPLDLAGRLVQEDLCLLLPEGGSCRLVGASLCAPNRWRLADKLGTALTAIHGPVPGYAATLAPAVDRFLARLTPEKPVWRLNWGIADDPAPFQPVPTPAPTPITATTAGERLWLRVERQTLRRLPSTGAILFTIRTHITRLDAAIARAEAAAELAAALRAMPAPMQTYKRIAPIAPALLAWLDRRAAGAPPQT
jgi:dimethylamine monooxygenase subunit A